MTGFRRHILPVCVLAAILAAQSRIVHGTTPPEPEVWMPASATFLAYLDLGTFMSTSAFQGLDRLLEAQDARGDLEQFRELTGMDPWRDIYTATYFSQPAETGKASWGLAIDGAFDVERILTSLQERQEVTKSDYRDTVLYLPSGLAARADGSGQPHAFAFVYGTTILVGPMASVSLMLDVSMGLEPSSADGPLAAALDRLSSAEALWVVSTGETHLGERLTPPTSESVSIPPLQSFAVSARLGSGVSFKFEGRTRDAEATRKLADIVRGAMALAALSPDTDSGLSDISESLEIEAIDERVDVSFEIDSRTVRSWLREQQKRLDARSP